MDVESPGARGSHGDLRRTSTLGGTIELEVDDYSYGEILQSGPALGHPGRIALIQLCFMVGSRAFEEGAGLIGIGSMPSDRGDVCVFVHVSACVCNAGRMDEGESRVA